MCIQDTTLRNAKGITAVVHYEKPIPTIDLVYNSKNKKLFDDIFVSDSSVLVLRGRALADPLAITDVITITTTFNLVFNETITVSDKSWDSDLESEHTLNGSALGSGLLGMTKNRNSPPIMRKTLTTVRSDTISSTDSMGKSLTSSLSDTITAAETDLTIT